MSEETNHSAGDKPAVPSNSLLGTCMYGVRPELPVRGFPPGRIRIRQRNTEFPRAFVKTANGIRHFIIAELDGHWVPYAEQGANHSPNEKIGVWTEPDGPCPGWEPKDGEDCRP